MKIQADIINGIYEVKDFDIDTDITDQDMFYSLLDDPTIFDQEVLGTEIDSKMKTKIESLYGKIN